MYDNYEPPPEQEKKYDPRSDTAVQQAMELLKAHFTNVRNDPIKTPYFIRQLQVLYEADYYPWIIANALSYLEEDGFLISFFTNSISGHEKLKNVQPMKFYCTSKTVSTSEDLKKMHRKALSVARVVDKYSHSQVTHDVGKHLEELIWHELRAQQFENITPNTNQYRDKKWTESNKNLDFIAEHKSAKLTIGVEIKNTLEIMPREEMDEKIRMCEYLDIIPVFPVRWMKPYINEVSNRGGFCWIFKTQMYPLGYRHLVQEIYKRLSVTNKSDSSGHKLQFPVITRTRLPDKSVERFQNWVTKKTS